MWDKENCSCGRTCMAACVHACVWMHTYVHMHGEHLQRACSAAVMAGCMSCPEPSLRGFPKRNMVHRKASPALSARF